MKNERIIFSLKQKTIELFYNLRKNNRTASIYMFHHVPEEMTVEEGVVCLPLKEFEHFIIKKKEISVG